MRRLFAFLFLAFAPALSAQQTRIDTVRAGRFDSGKMWTFEYAPMKFFSETYGFDANDEWFERARLAALRIPGCSASFVSPNGLIVTNHHCARDGVVRVTKPGELLLDTGFYARTLAQERRVENFYADQLIAVHDVSDEVFAASDAAASDAERPSARAAAMRAIRERLRTEHASAGDSVVAQVVSLYAGGRYSAYVFRRFTDVRLAHAVELQLGFFGGDADNFTYPRYDLDFAFLRVYGRDGKPVQSPSYFKLSQTGVREDDVVFVIGNPGPTTRMNSVAQLEFIRDVQLPVEIAVQQMRWGALNAELQTKPPAADVAAIRNQMFSLSNRLKAAAGRSAALNDPVILAKRRDAERQLESAINAKPELKAKYGDVLAKLADVQQRKRAFAAHFGLAYQFGQSGAMPTLVRRGLLVHQIDALTGRGAPDDSIAVLRDSLRAMRNRIAPIERALMTSLLQQWLKYGLGNDSLARAALDGRSLAEVTAALSTSPLADSTGDVQVTLDDPAVQVVSAFQSATAAYRSEWPRLLAEEAEWNARLGRARFEIYGTDLPPDASSSPRITDGVVKRYDYNGTVAPPYTTFFGMFDRYASFGPGTEWDLPKRWVARPKALDLETPLNFISTADTYGGNSGSPAVTKGLELVGLNFDRNINGLSRDYVYLPERGRNIMVDTRAIVESLDAVYDAHRLLLEVTTGKIYTTEAAADAARKK